MERTLRNSPLHEIVEITGDEYRRRGDDRQEVKASLGVGKIEEKKNGDEPDEKKEGNRFPEESESGPIGKDCGDSKNSPG